MPISTENKNEIIKTINTIVLAAIVCSIDYIMATYYQGSHAYVMLTIWILIGFIYRNFIGRFLSIVIVNMMCWPLTSDPVLRTQLSDFSRIGDIYFSQLDIAFILIFIIWFYKTFNKKNSFSSVEVYPIDCSLQFILCAFAFGIATLIGILSVDDYRAVFRDGKIFLIYLAYFPFRSLLNKEDLVHMFSVIMIVLTIAVIVAYFLTFSAKTVIMPNINVDLLSSRTDVDKGISKIDYLFFPGALWALILAWYSEKHWKLFLLLSLFLFSGLIISISRAYLISNLVTLLFIIYSASFSLKQSDSISHRRKVSFIFIGLFFISFILLYFVFASNMLIAAFDRIGSLFGYSYGATIFNLENAMDRMFAVEYGIKSALENPMGHGFGGYTLSDIVFPVGLWTLMYHSLPFMLLYTFGLFGSLIILYSWLSIIKSAYIEFITFSSKENSIISGIAFTYIVSQLIIGFGGNTLLRADTLFAIACAALSKCSIDVTEKMD